MEEFYADYVVIGSGPAGQKAAIQATKLGKTVIVLEKDSYPGGSSLNSGTIPSKSLREAIIDLTDFYKRSFYGRDQARKKISINDLNYRLNKVIGERRKMILQQFEKNKIKLLYGHARFEDPHHVLLLNSEDHILCKVRGDFFLIASGSQPRNPLGVPFDNEVILDSTRLLRINHVPKTLLVLGGGVIGSEYASFFAALGTKVTVADKKDHMLPLLDAEIGVHLQKALSEIGLKMMGKKELEKIERIENHAIVQFTDGTQIQTEMLLYALGRKANVEHLHIEAAGVTLDGSGYIPNRIKTCNYEPIYDRGIAGAFTQLKIASFNPVGYIPVNALFQTSAPHIYAAGDVIGGPCLASTSMEQGRLAARHAFGVQTHHFPTFYPIGIYTIPEISSCGYTEEQLKELGFRYEIGRAYYYEIARNIIIGNDPGMFKILFHADTLEILGIHIIGRAATKLIHIGQIAMNFNARIDYFIDQVFNYPTYAEGYRIAALNGYNKLKHRK